MGCWRLLVCLFAVSSAAVTPVCGQAPAQLPASSSRHVRKPAMTEESPLDAGRLSNGIFRNRDLGFSCTIPAGWVLRTEEMNAEDENEPSDAGQVDPQKDPPAHAKAIEASAHKTDGRVLLAAFSRPPQATGEDVNASILIAGDH